MCTFPKINGLIFTDTIGPSATFENCSDDILTNEAVVNYTVPTASDGGESLVVSCEPESGSTFLENNVTVVVCNAFDEAGNVATNNCNFTVTVGRCLAQLFFFE